MKKTLLLLTYLMLALFARSQCAYTHEGNYTGKIIDNTAYPFPSWIVAVDSVTFTLHNFFGAPFTWENCDDSIIGLMNCENDSVSFSHVLYVIDIWDLVEFYGSGKFVQDTLITDITSVLWNQNYTDTNYFHIVYNRIHLGIKSSSLESVKVYPIPATNTLSLILPSDEIIDHVCFYNKLGQLVLTSHEKNIININSIVPGFYILTITTNTNSLYKTTFIKK